MTCSTRAQPCTKISPGHMLRCQAHGLVGFGVHMLYLKGGLQALPAFSAVPELAAARMLDCI